MKKDNKKALYESIMTSVAKEVKKALNELSSDTYFNASRKQAQILNDDDYIINHSPEELYRLEQRRAAFNAAGELAKQREDELRAEEERKRAEEERKTAQRAEGINNWKNRQAEINQKRLIAQQRLMDLEKAKHITPILSNIYKVGFQAYKEKCIAIATNAINNILGRDITDIDTDQWKDLNDMCEGNYFDGMEIPFKYKNIDFIYIGEDGFFGLEDGTQFEIDGVQITYGYNKEFRDCVYTCIFQNGDKAKIRESDIDKKGCAGMYNEAEKIVEDGIKKMFEKTAKTYKYMIRYSYCHHLKSGFYSDACMKSNDDDQDLPEIALGKSKKSLIDSFMDLNDDSYFTYYDYYHSRSEWTNELESTNADVLWQFFYNNDGDIITHC